MRCEVIIWSNGSVVMWWARFSASLQKGGSTTSFSRLIWLPFRWYEQSQAQLVIRALENQNHKNEQNSAIALIDHSRYIKFQHGSEDTNKGNWLMIHAFPLFVSSSKVACRMMCSQLTKKELKFVRNIISASRISQRTDHFWLFITASS